MPVELIEGTTCEYIVECDNCGAIKTYSAENKTELRTKFMLDGWNTYSIAGMRIIYCDCCEESGGD